MFCFQWQCEPIDDTSQYFKELSHTIEMFCFIYKPEENVVNLLSDECSQSKELPINPMQDSLEEVTLSWIFTIKKLQELLDKLLINVSLCNAGLEIRTLQESQEEFIHQLYVRPRGLECGLILLRVKIRIITWRKCPEDVSTDHFYYIRIR